MNSIHYTLRVGADMQAIRTIPAYNGGMKKFTLLGGLTPARFMRDYWQKKPLLIRQAIPEFSPVLNRDELFALAGREDVESHLVTRFARRWQMQSGPFTRLPDISKKAWTLLVQGVNLHDDAADALLRQFRFISDARLDDLMISYATDGGGVGPHFDSYDVFLLQAYGRRLWRIGNQSDLDLVEGLPLKILRDFRPEQEFVLEPGDMLYLPPHYAHDGTAIGECMTCSIGFRSPSYQELGEAFLEFMMDSIDLPGRYADPDLAPARHPAKLERPMMERIAGELKKLQFTDEDMRVFIGEYLSEPKPSVFFDRPQRRMNAERFEAASRERGIVLSRKTQMLYNGRWLHINGNSFIMKGKDRALLTELADRRRLEGQRIAEASSDLQSALHVWHEDGWLGLEKTKFSSRKSDVSD
jgi:50S ribosomal protein L16 3-hydroxylase